MEFFKKIQTEIFLIQKLLIGQQVNGGGNEQEMFLETQTEA